MFLCVTSNFRLKRHLTLAITCLGVKAVGKYQIRVQNKGFNDRQCNTVGQNLGVQKVCMSGRNITTYNN